MTQRHILRIEKGQIVVLQEEHFESEQVLHDAVAAHPEVLPVEDLGLEPLVTLASEITVEGGYIDSLAADRLGRLAILEYKKGTENPDARKVVAQLLDYASSLWGMTYDELEGAVGLELPLSEHVQRGLADPDEFDESAFRDGVENSLESGRIALIYVARDLDERMSRVMRYLAESVRMPLLAVEVDYFKTDEHESAVLVPRAVVAPSASATTLRATESPSAEERLSVAPPEVRRFKELLDAYANERGIQATPKKMVIYRDTSGLAAWLDADVGYLQFDFKSLRGRDDGARLDKVSRALDSLSGGEAKLNSAYPSIACGAALRDWGRTRVELLDPYFT